MEPLLLTVCLHFLYFPCYISTCKSDRDDTSPVRILKQTHLTGFFESLWVQFAEIDIFDYSHLFSLILIGDKLLVTSLIYVLAWSLIWKNSLSKPMLIYFNKDINFHHWYKIISAPHYEVLIIIISSHCGQHPVSHISLFIATHKHLRILAHHTYWKPSRRFIIF